MPHHLRPGLALALSLGLTACGKPLEFSEGDLQWSVSGGSRATLEYVALGDKVLLADNTEPLLAATLLHAPDYHPESDWFPYETETGEYRVERVERAGDQTVRLTGALDFPTGAIRFDILIEAHPEPAHLTLTTSLEPEGDFTDRLVREVRLQVPLALDWRKRVGQGGDRGLDWDTRYFYEFTYGTVRIQMPPYGVPHPDRNEWRIFSVEQMSPLHFRVWRSESESTSPLVHQYGHEAAGWSSIYDKKGGLLIGYRDMPARAPKALRVEPAGQGRIHAQLHPDTRPAERIQSALLSKSLWDQEHVVDLLPFTGEAAEPQAALARIWDKEAPLSGKRPKQGMKDLKADAWPDWDEPDPPADLGPYVQGGIPLDQGILHAPDTVALFKKGRQVPVQTKPLAYWPDGSIKWLHLVFALPGDSTMEEEPPLPPETGLLHSFEVTFRNRAPETFSLHPAHADYQGPEVDAVRVTQENDEVRIDNGLVSLTLGSGEDWLKRLEAQGNLLHESSSHAPLASIDFLNIEGGYPTAKTHPVGERDDGPLHIENVDIEEAGPLRAMVRLQGTTRSAEPTQVIMRLKVFANRPWVEIDQSVVFNFSDPRKTLVRNFQLSLPFAPTSDPYTLQTATDAGLFSRTGEPNLSIRQESPLGGQMIEHTESGAMAHPFKGGQGWLHIDDGERVAAVLMRHFREEYPNALSFDADAGRLVAGFWPASAPLMDVRRYSNYPHQPQGESAGHGSGNEWVQKSFYPEDHVFVGISKSHQLAWVFPEAGTNAEVVAGINADFQSRPLIYSGPDAYRPITLPTPDYEQFPLLAQNLDPFTDFWLFHQRFWNWFGFWNHGDFQHRFRSGYGRVIDIEKLIELWQMPEEERPERLEAGYLTLDYRPQQDWAFDNGRWGWTNTEGLPGLYLQNEYFRTGRRDVFFAAEAMARYSRDVITRHDGAFAGGGTRHGVQPWSDGNHDPRSTVFAEYRFHYFLTGDSRSREVMQRLATEFYNRGTIQEPSYHSARLYGLLTWWEITGADEDRDLFQQYARELVVPEGIAIGATVAFTEDGPVRRKVDGVNSTGMFFHNFGGMHALLEYDRLTADPVVREGLLKMATTIGTRQPASDRAARAMVRNVGWLAKLYAFGATHADDPEPFLERIRQWLETEAGGFYRYQLVATNPEHWTGDTAFMTGLTPGTFFIANNLPVLISIEETEREPGQRLQSRLQQRDEKGEKNPKPRLSWQHAHDTPKLREYFGPWRPSEFSYPE